MNRELIVEPEAEAEIDEAASRYDAQNPGLGTDFLRAVGAAAPLPPEPEPDPEPE